jgi:hypothetical protein
MKVSPTQVQRIVLLLDVGNANSKSEMFFHWLPIATTLTIMDPNQPEPVIKLTISIRQESSQYPVIVLIDSTTTLILGVKTSRHEIISWGNVPVVKKSLFELKITSKGFPRVKYSHPQTFRLVKHYDYHILNVQILSLVYRQ